MKRRSFIQTTTAATLGLSLGAYGCSTTSKSHTKVLIIGAGLSGLYTGLLLEKAGIEYQILEASQRIGGRVFTNNQFGIPIEWGAKDIQGSDKRVQNLAQALNVDLIKSASPPEEWMIRYHGKNLNSKQWSEDSINPLSDQLRHHLPDQIGNSVFLNEPLPVKNDTDWYQPYIHTIDYSFREYLANKGYSTEAIRIADLTGDYNNIGRVSTLQVLRSLAHKMKNENKQAFTVKGGCSRLPEAMAKILSPDILLGKKVSSISEEIRSIKVQCSDGSNYSAEQVICTIPFSTLKDIQLNANLNKRQKSALKHLKYTHVTMGIIGVKNKFWEEDQFPADMWLENPLERVQVINSIEDQDVYLKVLINGAGARLMDQYSAKRKAEIITNELHRVRPSTKNQLEVLDTFSWGNYQFNQGAYAEFQSGQVQRFIPFLAEPTARMIFAGEHTSFGAMGMEGALASAEKAYEVLSSRL